MRAMRRKRSKRKDAAFVNTTKSESGACGDPGINQCVKINVLGITENGWRTGVSRWTFPAKVSTSIRSRPDDTEIGGGRRFHAKILKGDTLNEDERK